MAQPQYKPLASQPGSKTWSTKQKCYHRSWITRQVCRTLLKLGVVLALISISFVLLVKNRVLPNVEQGYIPAQPDGSVVTDVTLARCSILQLFASCTPDADDWHRVDKELYLRKAWTATAYIYVKRKAEVDLTEDDKIVTDLWVGRDIPSTADSAEWEARSGGLWVKSSKKHKTTASEDAVTGVDVLFGDDAVEARDGWAMSEAPLDLGTGGRALKAYLTVRRGSSKENTKPKLQLDKNGRFKILQVADLHLVTGVGRCDDPVPDDGNCQADPRSLAFVTRMLRDEKPDLVVLSGDQVNGDTAPDAPTAILKISKVLIDHKIPYVAIFGNHDDEESMSRARQMEFLEMLPYSLSQAGPKDVDGVGNYYVEILDGSKPAVTIYMLDTHAYSSDRKYSKYDWLKPSQIKWFHDTAKSLKARSTLDISFIHIPLPEYNSPKAPRVGKWREEVMSATYNPGFRDALLEEGVVMVSAGHDHCNEYCLLSSNDKIKDSSLWMCYAGGVGFGGYGGDGFVRRVRIFDIDTKSARITTWKRLENGEDAAHPRIDEQVIVDAGKPKAL